MTDAKNATVSPMDIAGMSMDVEAIRKELMGANPSEFVEVETDVWKPTSPGETLYGKLIAKEKSNFTDDSGVTANWWMFAALDVKTGTVVPKRMLGTTVIERSLASVEPGTIVEIEFKGAEKNARGSVKLYKVRVPKK